jgi:hypothetical protein
MMNIKIALVVLAAAAVAVSGAMTANRGAGAPKKPEWPWTFNATFGFYSSVPFTAKVVNETSYFYYDWTNNNSTLIHYPQKCNAILGKAECWLVFNPTGVHVLTENKTKCCLAVGGVGSVPPNFLRGFQYDTEEAMTDFYGTEHQTFRWVQTGGPGFLSTFYYWTDVESGTDVRFQDGFKQIQWYWAPLNVGPQDPEHFYVPDTCTQSCLKFENKDGHYNTQAEADEVVSGIQRIHMPRM